MNSNDVKEIMKLTCFDSLAFCCDLVKPCPVRNKAMETLGLKPEEFSKLKEEFNKGLEKIILGE